MNHAIVFNKLYHGPLFLTTVLSLDVYVLLPNLYKGGNLETADGGMLLVLPHGNYRRHIVVIH